MTGGGTLLSYTMVTGGGYAAAVAIGMTTEFKNNIYSFYYVFTILQGLPTRRQRQRQRRRQQQQQQQRQQQRQQQQQQQKTKQKQQQQQNNNNQSKRNKTKHKQTNKQTNKQWFKNCKHFLIIKIHPKQANRQVTFGS